MFDNIDKNGGTILSQNINRTSHGSIKKSKDMDILNNIDLFRSLVEGTKERIKYEINAFFSDVEEMDTDNNETTIKAGDTDKKTQEYYNKFALFINDNSMGNMMLLDQYTNKATEYRDANFSGKRKFVLTKRDDKIKNDAVRNYPIPIGTYEVLMGKYIDENSSEQWLMGERKKYLENMVKVLKDYYK